MLRWFLLLSGLLRTSQFLLVSNRQHDGGKTLLAATIIHHTALKTRNITNSIHFYSLLGYRVTSRFRTGPARAAWLELLNESRLELIEVPEYMLMLDKRQRAPDLMKYPNVLGYNHVAFHVKTNLTLYLESLNRTSIERFGKGLNVVVPPRQQIIGCDVYELCFLHDADGCLVELLYRIGNAQITSSWERWNASSTTTEDLLETKTQFRC
mgnify:CR=1 FL=1